MMLRPALFALTMFVCGLAAPASAACYADYKAKQGDPLKLHYGVIEVSDAACRDPGRARAEVDRRIRAGGWTLLNVLGTFGPEGLEPRKDSAGSYFLRY